MPLTFLAFVLREKAELFGSLDPFSDNADLQPSRHRDDRQDDRCVVFVVG